MFMMCESRSEGDRRNLFMRYRPNCSDVACPSTLAHAVLPVSCPTKPQPCLLLNPEDAFRNHLACERKRIRNTQNQLEDTFLFPPHSACVKESGWFKKKKKTRTKKPKNKPPKNPTKKQMADKVSGLGTTVISLPAFLLPYFKNKKKDVYHKAPSLSTIGM